jgi:hypothetical protein
MLLKRTPQQKAPLCNSRFDSNNYVISLFSQFWSTPIENLFESSLPMHPYLSIPIVANNYCYPKLRSISISVVRSCLSARHHFLFLLRLASRISTYQSQNNQAQFLQPLGAFHDIYPYHTSVLFLQ